MLVPSMYRSTFVLALEVLADLAILLFVLLARPSRGPALITAAAALLAADTLYALSYKFVTLQLFIFPVQVAFYLLYILSAAYYIFRAYAAGEPLEKVEKGIFLVIFSAFVFLQTKYVVLPFLHTTNYVSLPLHIATSFLFVLYRLAESAVIAMAVLLGMRARSRYWFYLLNGLTLLSISSFALGFNGTMGTSVPFQECGWVLGLLSILAAQTYPLRDSSQFARCNSLRVRLVWFVSAITAGLLLLLYLLQAFAVKDAFHLTSSLFFLLFGVWFVANLISFLVAEDIRTLLDGLEAPDSLAAHRGFRLTVYEAELFAEKLRAAYDTIKSQSHMAALSKLSAQVAHDIRSPLAALDSALRDVAQLPESQRLLIRGAAGRIRDIANDLLEKHRDARTAAGHLLGPRLLSGLIGPVIAEKRLQFRDRPDVAIDFSPGPDSYGLFAKVQPAEFSRILSNLINNGVEALAGGGSVVLGLSREKGAVALSVSDNGKGIAPELLPRIGQMGETHGKAGGSGLGLHHARTTVEGWGGSFAVSSEAGKGTTVTLTLPQAAQPEWLVPEKPEPAAEAAGRQALLLDDDALVHLNWGIAARSAGINLKPYKKAGEFLAAAETLPKDTPVYIDSELGEGVFGEEIARDLHQKGFTDITMATGHAPERFGLLTWLKVSGKEPPWGRES